MLKQADIKIINSQVCCPDEFMYAASFSTSGSKFFKSSANKFRGDDKFNLC